ncbi:DUF4145 domain-containing protein [Psychrobacter sp. CAM01]|uniref:DUF4145 domain-containing protein n=1 Tax=Psychrobacter sp. CAM01 TaxID=3080335 RepID=UPI0029362C4A|nr:DUF4145 domain-containing protein [Psychrobacter sp. CAM01]MDV2860105.1 DUF4145 domain-containing protein [Psychrobacter sp. CAM01]
MKFIAPEFKKDGFHCPLCGTYAHMNWSRLSNGTSSTNYYESLCSYCSEPSLWRITKYNVSQFGKFPEEAELIFPDNGLAALPEDDMPKDVKTDYVEAARIFSKSPRGAAALLRLGLQKLCKHLGEDGSNINNDIRSLAAKNVLPPMVVRVADTVRITGNNAVHPGTMKDEDFDFVASKMFDLLNFIVKKGISEPKELDALYQLTPEGPRKSAEDKDAKSKVSNL